MFPNHLHLPNRISLCEGWYTCWRSIQICYCHMTRGHNPKRAAIPKAKSSTAQSVTATLTMTGPKHTSGTALFFKTCSVAAWIHPSCQLWSLLWFWTPLVPWEKCDEWRCWILLVLTRVEECWQTSEGSYTDALYDVRHLELSRI